MIASFQRGRIDRAIPGDASLYLDFARAIGRVAGVAADPYNLLSTTRASPATAIGDDGQLVTVAANVPRITRSRRGGGLLVERATTNYIYPSGDLTDARWTKTAMTAASAAAIGPDGAMSASVLQDTAATGSTPGTVGQTIAVSAAAWWVAGFDVKMMSGTKLTLFVGIAGSSSISGYVTVDMTTGAVVSQGVIGSTSIIPYVDPAPNGYLRVSLAISNTVGAGALVAQLSRDSSASSPIQFSATNAFCEQASAPSSRIVTTTGAGERHADEVSIDLTTSIASTWYLAGQGTLVVEADLEGPVESEQTLIATYNAFASFMLIGRGPSPWNVLKTTSVVSGAVTAYGQGFGATTLPRTIRAAVSFAAGMRHFAAGGGAYELGATPFAGSSPFVTGVIDAAAGYTGAVPPSQTALHIGHINGALQLDGRIARMAYFPQPLGDADLTALVL